MVWIDYVVPILFVCLFVYGLVKQVQQSAVLHKTVLPDTPFNKRLLIGNYLYSFSFGGFILLLILNVFVYLGILPQNQQVSNTVSIITFLFLLLMFISKFAVIPKNHFQSLRPILKKYNKNVC